MTRFGRMLVNLLFPAKCILCNRIIHAEREETCEDCRAALTRPSVSVKLDYIEGAVAATEYDAVREAIIRFKFKGQHWLSEPLGELVAEAVADKLGGRFDTITYAPLGEKRRKKRGYNQAQLLAEVVGVRLELPVMETLRKTKETVANSSLSGDDSRELRRSNVAGAYEALAGVEGLRFLLVDDVLTTGATASECARTLLLGGAESVVCATVALADSGRDR